MTVRSLVPWALAALLVAALMLGRVAPAHAARGMEVAISDEDAMVNGKGDTALAYQTAQALNATRMRILVEWSRVSDADDPTPSLDPDYGQTAISTLQSFIAAYPDSPLKPRAQREIDRLTEWLAIKNYDTGMFYYRRKAYDPAIIYFNDVERLYPTTQHAKLALIQLVKSYQQIKYPEEIAQTCATLYQKYPGDAEVKKTCGPPPAPATATPKP